MVDGKAKVLRFKPADRRDPHEARRLIRAALTKGAVSFCRPARDAMEEDEVTAVEVTGALRAGVVHEAEHEGGDWRYHIRTPRTTVVVAFRSESEVVVVTVWRN
jgi:hypothetical protein